MMGEIILTNEIILKIKKEAFYLVHRLMGGNLASMILYGSCARGDYTRESDVDIALLTKCDRMEAKKYDDGLDAIATQLAMKYFAVVNFVCLPQDEFIEKKHGMVTFKILKRKERCSMDKEYAQILAKIRLDRADELLSEAQELLEKGE